jgi:hypothetical protein
MRIFGTQLTTFTLTILALLPSVFTNPIAGPEHTELVARAPIHRQTCSGDNGGTAIGVLVCCDIDFYDKYEMVVKLSVKDSRGDSNDVYGWCVATDANGKTYQVPSSKLRNSQGVGTTVYQSNIRFTLPCCTGIRYVSARGCVDDAGSDTCADYKGRETINPF